MISIFFFRVRGIVFLGEGRGVGWRIENLRRFVFREAKSLKFFCSVVVLIVVSLVLYFLGGVFLGKRFGCRVWVKIVFEGMGGG